MGFPGATVIKESTCLETKDMQFNPWVGKIPWRRKWQPAPAFLSEKFDGQRSQVATIHRAAKNQT